MLKTTERETLHEIQLAREPDVELGKAWLRPASRLLEFGQRKQPLEPRVAQLLVALARQKGQVLGRDDLIDLCWGGRIVGEDAVNRCVAKARKAIEAAGLAIETVPKVGYRLVSASSATRPAWRRQWLLAPLAGLALGCILAAYLWASRSPARPEYPPIAVGDFTTKAGQRELQGRTADIRSQVVDALLRTGIRIVRTSAPAGEPARYLVRGEISAKPEGIHALVQLDDTETARTVFSRELDLDPDEAPLLADKVAASVADAVTRTGAYYALTANGADRDDLGRFLGIAMQTASGDYLEAEVQARQFLESRPDSKLAPFALSFATIYALPQLPMEERPDAIARARHASTLARQRLPQFGDVHIAPCKLYPVDYGSCEKRVRSALAVDPTAPTLRTQLALLLMDAGRLQEARPLMTKALAENPFNPSKVIQSLYLAQLVGARSEEAYVWAYAQRYWPKLRFAMQRFSSLMANGRWVEAERMLPLVLRVSPGSEATLGIIFTALHSPTESNKLEVERMCSGELEPATGVACFTGLSMLGRPKAANQVAQHVYPALKAQDAAAQERLFIANGSDPGPFFFVWGDGAKGMRQDPTFALLADQVGLVRYWKERGQPDLCKRESTPVCKLAASR